MNDTIRTLIDAVGTAGKAIASDGDDRAEAQSLQDLGYRLAKLERAAARPQCLGFFGPSQAGKSFLVGAILSHELGTLEVVTRSAKLDFLKEINPAKGVESTGVVTRFSTGKAPSPLQRGDFHCSLLSLEVVLESMATGFLVECTAPVPDLERVEQCLRQARLEGGPDADPRYRKAWENVWHNLQKKYQSRHAYLNELRANPELRSGAWKDGIRTRAGWLRIYSLLWGGSGYAKDLERLMGLLDDGLDDLAHAELVEVGLEHVRAASAGASIVDAACLNSLGRSRDRVGVHDAATGRDVEVDAGVLSALIAEIRMPLVPVPGTLLDGTDMLDFPGGRALKGINGFGHSELNAGSLDNAIEVYKRGKLTFLFEQYAIDREITALVLCSPGPTKPEAIQLQTQVERWLHIRHGAPTPSDSDELTHPSLFMALTKFDMSLGALRSDNARDRWDSRVGESCVEFWARNHASWINNWGGDGRAFTNMYWICNPYADQMRTLRPGDADYEAVKQGYLESSAVQRYIGAPADKWRALEGQTDDGLPKSGIPLLVSALRAKMAEDIKGRELSAELRHVHAELVDVLRALTPSRDEAEARQRQLDSAAALVSAVRAEMVSRFSGAAFGEFVELMVPPLDHVEDELEKIYGVVAPMSIKVSDKVKKVLVHILKWWAHAAAERHRSSTLALPRASVDRFVREVCTSKKIMPVLGKTIFPYFSRKEIDQRLIARILQVKISDALIELFESRPRRTPTLPVRLSYSETVGGGEEADEVDWTDVDFDDEPVEETPDEAVEIIFAGKEYFDDWSTRLGPFYVAASGGKAQASLEDPRNKVLLALLNKVEKTAIAVAG